MNFKCQACVTSLAMIVFDSIIDELMLMCFFFLCSLIFNRKPCSLLQKLSALHQCIVSAYTIYTGYSQQLSLNQQNKSTKIKRRRKSIYVDVKQYQTLSVSKNRKQRMEKSRLNQWRNSTKKRHTFEYDWFFLISKSFEGSPIFDIVWIHPTHTHIVILKAVSVLFDYFRCVKAAVFVWFS